MQESMLIGLAVVAILVVVVGVVLFMKREHFEIKVCPTGFKKSSNGYACVLPGEKPKPCNKDQIHIDQVCRQRLTQSSIQRMPPGWRINSSSTGIQPVDANEPKVTGASTRH
jgi:hypothetical protein